MTYLSIFGYKKTLELVKEQQHNNNINNCKKNAEIFWRCSLEKKKKISVKMSIICLLNVSKKFTKINKLFNSHYKNNLIYNIKPFMFNNLFNIISIFHRTH